MSVRDPDHKDSLDVDGDDDGSTGEETQFLPTHLPSDMLPSKSTQRYVVLMCVQFLFIVEFSQFIMEPPLQEIMEDFVCHSHYPDHLMGAQQVQDSRCKDADTQRTLAMARSWMMWVSMFVPLLVQIPYGIMADRYGRRPVLFLGLFGVVLSTAWDIIVLLRPDVFSIWHLLLDSIPALIGGGGPVITAMVWTILSDSVSADKRTSLFYQLYAMMLILSAAFRPIAGWLMSIDPWLPMWMGLGALVLSMFSSLLIPETLQLHKMANHNRHQAEEANRDLLGDGGSSQPKQGVLRMAWSMGKRDLFRIWHLISSSKSLMLLVAADGLYYPINIAFEMNMLQYVTKRFDWDWSTATYFTTISKVTSVLVLLVFLPLSSFLLTKRFKVGALTRDLYLSRGSVLCVAAGNALTAAAAAPWLLVSSLVVLSLGNGFQPQIRALLAGIVEPHHLATLNTTVASVETLTGLFSVPVLGWLLSKGFELGGAWMGLPFVITFFCAILATVSMFVFRIPGISKAGERYELQPLR